MIPEHYPRPNLYRSSWKSLNGPWDFDYYDDDFLVTPEEKVRMPLTRVIEVPFAYQSEASGIGDKQSHRKLLYRRIVSLDNTVDLPRIILHFGAVDYRAEVWINQINVGTHEGGYTPFSFDITESVGKDRTFSLTVICTDSTSPEQPRGKQTDGTPFACWYTATSGIWREVWLEYKPFTAIESIKSSNTGNSSLVLDVGISGPVDRMTIRAEVSYQGEITSRSTVRACYPLTRIPVDIDNPLAWSPENPALYDIELTLWEGENLIDQVESYTSFRTVELRKEGLYLNGTLIFQRLILMQGYWDKSGYTAPETEAFSKDIHAARSMGFNGCRMHMKFEDPRFLYAADRIGFLVWEEAPAFFHFSRESRSAFLQMWIDALSISKHHPSVVVRVICNESWGIREIASSLEIRTWLRELYLLLKELDPDRPIIGNDGWEHVVGDLITLHSYEHTPEELRKDWSAARNNDRCGIERRPLWLDGPPPPNLPWVLSEFGGISYLRDDDTDPFWGYQDVPENETLFRERLKELFLTAYNLDGITGWCYTQFSDIEQEKNGLFYSDRTAKIDPVWVRTMISDIEKV